MHRLLVLKLSMLNLIKYIRQVSFLQVYPVHHHQLFAIWSMVPLVGPSRAISAGPLTTNIIYDGKTNGYIMSHFGFANTHYLLIEISKLIL